MVTAADRAAATFAVWGTNPSARLRRAPPLSGEAVSRSLTEDIPLRARRPTSHVRGGSVSRRGLNQLARNPRPPCMGAQVRRNVQVCSHPLFGRGGAGGRGASLREAASPPSVPPPTSLRAGARGRGFSTEKPPPPEFFLCISLYFSWFLLDGMEGTWYDAKQFHRRDESPPRKAMKSSSSRGASLAESREKVQVRQGEPVKEQLGASARKAQAK